MNDTASTFNHLAVNGGAAPDPDCAKSRGARSGRCAKGSRLVRRMALLSVVVLATGCAGQRAEQEAMQARQAAMELEVQRLADEAHAAEQARQQAEQHSQALRDELERLEREREELARAREAAEREAAERSRQAAELQRQQRAAEQARIAREQEERIAAMERQLAEADAAIQRREQANTRLNEAVIATEELVQMLASEQLKYDSVDEQGQTQEPLQKSLIMELEERKNTLVREAQALSN